MTDGKRKRSPLSNQTAKSTLHQRSKGFSSRDQRLPASPPTLDHSDASSGPGFMSAIRARYRDAMDKLFGTPPCVLNVSCISTSEPRAKKRARHSDTKSLPADQVVPGGPPLREHCEGDEDCKCANELWTVGGIGPELMLRTGEELSERILMLYSNAVDPKTSDVDYSSLVHSPDFRDYLRAARKLRYFDPLLLSESERKAFFLNVYNSLMIHAIAVLSKPVTMFDRVSLYNSASYDIGGRPYSLNMIEHGVLRGNKPGSGPFAQAPFAENDARKQCMLPKVDPRIHFALNCGAKSCPAVRFYESESLDRTLDIATHIYLQSVNVDFEKRIITLPKLLQWYKADFSSNGDTDTVLKWTLPYLESQKREHISTLLQEKEQGAQQFKILYAGYDWTVNDSSL